MADTHPTGTLVTDAQWADVQPVTGHPADVRPATGRPADTRPRPADAHSADAHPHPHPTGAHPLTLRWRVHEGRLTLRQRHLRSLDPLDLPAPLRGWIVERLEWALANLFDEESEGVLVLDLDPSRDVVLSFDGLREAPALTTKDLVVTDGVIVGARCAGQVLAGTVWLERDGVLYASAEELTAATATLACDLAGTLGLPVEVQPQQRDNAQEASVFLISDEFGFVPIRALPAAEAPATERMRECFAKLWETTP